MERRQLSLVFHDWVKQVGFKASFECGEGKLVFDCVWELIPAFCCRIAE